MRKLALRHVSPAELRSFASTSNPFSTTSWTLHAIARSNVNTISKQKRSAELEKLQKKRVVREQRRTREAQRDERRRALQDVYKQEVYDKRVHGRVSDRMQLSGAIERRCRTRVEYFGSD